MTHIKYKGHTWLKIPKVEWQFAGGETNPDLLKLPNTRTKNTRKSYHYFKRRDA